MDSIKFEDQQKNINKIVHIADQSTTDAEKALNQLEY